MNQPLRARVPTDVPTEIPVAASPCVATRPRGKRSVVPVSLSACLAGLLAVPLAGAPAHAQSNDYETCLAIAQDDPERGREHAAQWEALGGGSEAKHCAAIALIGLGLESSAAAILTELGTEAPDLNADDRSGSLLLAGDLWLRVDRPELAHASYKRVIDLRGADPSRFRLARIGMARAAAELGDWDETVQNLDRLLEQQPDDVEALTLRAAAHRAEERYERALRDAVAATEAAPDAALAWFERGAAERSLGRLTAARESWIQASLLDFSGPVGEMAQINLQRLEVGDFDDD